MHQPPGGCTTSAATVTTFQEMWNHPMRNLERIEKYLGTKHMQNLIVNLSSTVLVSLYSGLGGAEASKLNPKPKLKPKFRDFCKMYLFVLIIIQLGSAGLDWLDSVFEKKVFLPDPGYRPLLSSHITAPAAGYPHQLQCDSEILQPEGMACPNSSTKNAGGVWCRSCVSEGSFSASGLGGPWFDWCPFIGKELKLWMMELMDWLTDWRWFLIGACQVIKSRSL